MLIDNLLSFEKWYDYAMICGTTAEARVNLGARLIGTFADVMETVWIQDSDTLQNC
jgi:hypothetical protein